MASTDEYQQQNNWEVSMVKCDICNNEWCAVRPVSTKKLECSNCNNITNYEVLEYGNTK